MLDVPATCLHNNVTTETNLIRTISSVATVDGEVAAKDVVAEVKAH